VIERAELTPARMPMRQPRLAEMVAAELRKRILSGELPDGSLLPRMEELLQEFRVSLPSVREALRILETENLITVRRGNVGGAFVHAPHARSAAYMLALVLEARKVPLGDVALTLSQLEPLCAGMCAAAADRLTRIVPRLDAARQSQADAIDDGDLFATRGRLFHRELVSLCGSETLELLVGALESMWDAHERLWARNATRLGAFPEREVRAGGLRAHERLVKAIAAGDVLSAQKISARHLQEAQRHALGGSDMGVRADLLRASV
jgi:DNA-binding FadR family transcriptional regulator